MSIRSLLLCTAVVLAPLAASAESRTVCNARSGLNIRSSPSIHGGRIGGLSNGTRFEMLGTSRSGAWVKVRANGRTGWVSRQYVCGGGGGGAGSGSPSSGSGSGSAAATSGSGAGSGASAAPSSGAFVNPVPGACRSSGYGSRRDPIHGSRRFHDGTDFAAGNGTPMRSAFDGTVVRTGAMRGYGYAVVIRRDNPDGSKTFALYGHMCCGSGSRLGRSSLRVRPGDRVRAGDPIGQVGTTGRSTGPHLHLLMRRVPANAPADYRNPDSSSFFSRKYSVNPQEYISAPGCGGRGGVGGEDHDHDHDHGHGDELEGESGAAGLVR